MTKFDYVVKENIIKYNKNWLDIFDHLYTVLIIEGSGYGKTSALYNLISGEYDVDKIHLYAKDPNEAKCQLLINKQEKSDLKHFNVSKAFIEDSNDMDE